MNLLRISNFTLFLGGISIGLYACSSQEEVEQKNLRIQAEYSLSTNFQSALLKRSQSLFEKLPEAASFDDPKAKLGKELYYETALSANNKLSCNSCHLLDKYGVDNEATSPGHEGIRGERNSPSVYNAAIHIAQFWDGRAADLKEQAKGPILNPIEMGIASEAEAVGKIEALEAYSELFKKAFGSTSISYDRIAEAIAEFEKTLLTPGRFDQYLNGNKEALSSAEQLGLQTFISTGCITCHTGPGLGGNMYQKFGLVKGPYWKYTSSTTQDEGRFEHTAKEADKYVFKVPSLRNISKTAPYFHDGSVTDLSMAVDIMATTQLGKNLSPEEVESIVTFLESLSGDIPFHAL